MKGGRREVSHEDSKTIGETSGKTGEGERASDSPSPKNESKHSALLATMPSLSNAGVVSAFSEFGEVPLLEAATILQKNLEAVSRGSLEEPEALLMCQAQALNSIFVGLSLRAASYMGSRPDLMDRSLRLALKAQNQARATLEALASIKNPAVVFARQANFSAGHQQVNNGVSPQGALGGMQRGQTKLSEVDLELHPDHGTSATPRRNDSDVETLGAFNGAEDSTG